MHVVFVSTVYMCVHGVFVCSRCVCLLDLCVRVVCVFVCARCVCLHTGVHVVCVYSRVLCMCGHWE